VCTRVALALGGFTAASPAHDPVDRKSDDNHESECREVNGWAGARGESCGWEDGPGHMTSRRSVASQPAAETTAA
jgi:hypothetical protein